MSFLQNGCTICAGVNFPRTFYSKHKVVRLNVFILSAKWLGCGRESLHAVRRFSTKIVRSSDGKEIRDNKIHKMRSLGSVVEKFDRDFILGIKAPNGTPLVSVEWWKEFMNERFWRSLLRRIALRVRRFVSLWICVQRTVNYEKAFQLDILDRLDSRLKG